MAPGKGTWLTPNEVARNLTEMYTKLEHNTLPLEKIDLNKEMSYFNNTKATASLTEYDHFFAYTKVFPLYDHRKLRCNRHYLPDIWANIHEQERHKAVPVTTTLNYGRRPQYDFNNNLHNRMQHISNFYRRRGTFTSVDTERYSEDVPDPKI